MKTFYYNSCLVFVSGLFANTLYAQEPALAEREMNKAHHRISIFVAHPLIPATNEAGDVKKNFIVSTIGLNYDWWQSNKWTIGLHNDFIIQSFTYENSNNKQTVERVYPLLSTLVAVYKPGRHITVFTGPGREFEKHETFTVIKSGIEYGIELSKQWEVATGLEYDVKINGYNSWLPGIGFSRSFGGK
ncbi:MAG: hypothetical protein ABJB11_07205 [Ferruginibacter sp.]